MGQARLPEPAAEVPLQLLQRCEEDRARAAGVRAHRAAGELAGVRVGGEESGRVS